MTNICTKVTVRTKPIKNNRRSVYLDFYPAIRNPKNGGKTRREFLGIYIYDRPVEKFEKRVQQDHAPECRTYPLSQNRSHHC